MYDFEYNRRVNSNAKYSSGSTTPSPTLSPGSSLTLSNLYPPTPWSVYHPRHLALLSNRHRLHRFHNVLPQHRTSSLGVVPTILATPEKINKENKQDGKNAIRQLHYSVNNIVTDKPKNVSLIICNDKVSESNVDKWTGSIRKDINNNNTEFGIISMDTSDNGNYVNSWLRDPWQRMEHERSKNYEIDSGIFDLYGSLTKSSNSDAASDIKPLITSLKHNEDYLQVLPSNILGDLAFRLANNIEPDLDADYEYECSYLLSKARETKIVTAVFEIQNRGLEDLAASLDEELHLWLEQTRQNCVSGSLSNDDGAFVAVCCELFWSVPVKKRNLFLETKLKQNLGNYLRKNNWRVWNLVDKMNEGREDKKFVVLPQCTVDEQGGNDEACFVGSYRRYYDGLLPMKHEEAEAIHGLYWKFEPNSAPNATSWPLIAPQSKTSVLMLNLICLRFDFL